MITRYDTYGLDWKCETYADKKGPLVVYEDYQKLESEIKELRQQLEAAAGWIEWCGGECPVDEGVWVGFKLSSGITVEANNPEDWEWRWFDTDSRIVAYRLVS